MMFGNRGRRYGACWAVWLSVMLAVGFLSPAADAQETTLGEPSTPVAEESSTEHDVIPLFVGDVAPWTGLLVPELQFTEYLRLDLRVQELEGKLQIKVDLLAELQSTYEDAMREVATPVEESWWTRYGFTVGIVSGVVIGVGLVALGGWVVSLL